MPDGAATTTRTARLLAPYMLVRDQAQDITCPIYASGSLVAPSSGTVTIERPDGTTIIEDEAVTVTGSIATRSVTAAELPTSESFGARWQVVWTLVFASGVTPEVIVSDAALIRRGVYPTVAQADLVRRYGGLDPSATTALSSVTNWQDKIDLAWGMIIRSILNSGERPDLITSPSALHDAHMALVLALIFEDLETRLNDGYAAVAARHRDEYREYWRRLTYVPDADEDGRADLRRKRLAPSVWLGGFDRL